VIVTTLERAGSPLGSGLFQLMPNVSRSTTVWSVSPKRSPPLGVGDRIRDLPGDLRGLGVALDRDLAVDRDAIAVAVDRLGREGQFGVGLGVEEVRSLQVRGEVLVLDLNGGDLRGAVQHAVGDGGVEVAERSVEGARHVVDGEPDARMDLVDLPCAGG